MLYLYKKTTSTGTTIGITEATSERHLAERVLAAIPKDETVIALSGDALPDGLITLPALMDAVQELMAKEDNAHATDPNHVIEIAGETRHGGEADDFLSFLKNAINAYENRHNHNNHN